MLPPTVAPSAPPQAGVPRPGPLAPNPVNVVRLPLPPALKPAFSPWELLQALQRRWLLATVLGLLAAAAAATGAYYYHLQPEKKVAMAQALMLPSPHYRFHQPPAELPAEYEARLASEAELAKHPGVIQKALQDPELEKHVDFSSLAEADRLQWIAARLATYGNKDDGTITIMLQSEDNEKWLTPVVNALYRAYVQFSQDNEKAGREQHLAIRNQLYMEHGGQYEAQLKEMLDRKRQQPSSGAAQLEQELESLNAELNHHKSNAATIRFEMFTIQVERDVYREDLGSTEAHPEDIQPELDADEIIQDYQAAIPELDMRIRRIIGAFSDGVDNVAVKKLMAELKDLEEGYAYYRGKRIEEISAAIVAQKEAKVVLELQKHNRELRGKNKHLEAAQKQIARLEERVSDVKAWLSLTPGNAVDTTELEGKIKDSPYVGELRKEVNILKAELKAEPRVTGRSEAGPPTKQAAPIEYRKIGTAGGAALLAVLGCVSLLEYRTRRIHTAHEVVQGLGIRLLGAIPTWSPHSQQNGGYGGSLAYNLWTESVDTARTLVTHAAQAEAARVVMVTSATSGEGKTSLASHLASSLARAGHRTLLVDGDLRSPAVHALFDKPLGPGLCEVLRGQATVEDAVQETPARGLSLLTAGQWDADALQALAQGTAHEMFARLKEQYDYVIVDSSPVLAVADALMIGRHVDGVLLSILRDVSRVPTVYAAYQRLHMLGIRTLGAVVNGARSERYGSWYNAPAHVA